jgi:hypothetical protein
MGYRSTVMAAFHEKTFEKLLSSCDDNVAINVLLGADKHYKSDWILLHYDWVKWYDSFEEVKKMDEFINELEDNLDETFEFHRMGEEYDDYEVKGSGNSPFHICINRSLDFDA